MIVNRVKIVNELESKQNVLKTKNYNAEYGEALLELMGEEKPE